MTLDEIEEKICENMKAYDIYDKLLNEIINHQLSLIQNEKKENYEVCAMISYKIENLIAFRAIQINRLINVETDTIIELFNHNKIKLLNEIRTV